MPWEQAAEGGSLPRLSRAGQHGHRPRSCREPQERLYVARDPHALNMRLYRIFRNPRSLPGLSQSTVNYSECFTTRRARFSFPFRNAKDADYRASERVKRGSRA